MFRGALLLAGVAACASPDPRGAPGPSPGPSPGSSPGVSAAEPAAELAGERIIRARAYIQADYGEVWERFTTASGYEAWASTPCLEFPSRVGGEVVWGVTDDLRFLVQGRPERDDPPGTVYRGTLERLEHGRGLTHTFQFVGFGFEEPETRVDIEIVERGETVLVSIVHDCSDAPRTFEAISPVGWTKSLSRLKTLLETGAAMPWPVETGEPGEPGEPDPAAGQP